MAAPAMGRPGSGVPIYDFVCRDCRAKTEVFTRSVSTPVSAACSRCGGTNVVRAVSRFAFVRSDSEVYGDLGKVLDVDVDPDDPESMAYWAKNMKDTLGDDADPQLDDLIREGAAAGAGAGFAEAGGDETFGGMD